MVLSCHPCSEFTHASGNRITVMILIDGWTMFSFLPTGEVGVCLFT